jgi:hypothetical protein
VGTARWQSEQHQLKVGPFFEIRLNMRPVMKAFATRSSRVLHRVLVVGALAGALISTVGCGDDPVAPQQAVLWFGLGPAQGMSCSSAKTYQYPDGARGTVSGSTGVGDRAKDGSDYLVECDVRPASRNSSDYNVSLKFQGGEIGSFVATGVLTDGAAAGMQGTLDVDFATGQFGLAQDKCSVGVKTLVPGAIWLQSVHCDNMKDPSSPSIACDGTGALIFENCSH